MSLRVLKLAALVLFGYLIFLVAYLPAVQVLPRLPLPSQLSLQGVSGTVWQGNALRLSYQGLPIENLSWQLSPWGLLLGKANITVKAGNSRDAEQIALEGQVGASASSIASDGLTLYLPTDLVISQLPLPLPVNAKGRFKVTLDELEYGPDCQALLGKGQWLNAQVAGTQGFIDLGNFDADLGCVEGDITLNVKEPNRFGLSAEARIPANFKVKISGKFKPDPSLPQEVHNAAKLFGQPDSQGYYQIRF
ncbi:type II secretion system protein N [Aliiglaciecola sp. CAU 1673]|uniref:type II secretion system protein N n=1 Tax=Aliiglaciecola sp. CAU 1673 TaxID=3032595 RepID=UPI0023DCDFA4|nr:type II secretion system protein N [Aliiglaciecola sp. CAU 1673]MDF2179224.1 type II secretion system protein N [Aliiglaciecola sp. CAU 1673]